MGRPKGSKSSVTVFGASGAARTAAMTKLVPCAQCGNILRRTNSALKKAKNSFCSRNCKKLFYYRTGRKQVKCEYCEAPLTRLASYNNRRRDKHNFCNMHCVGKWNAWKDGHSRGYHYKQYKPLMNTLEQKCSVCGDTEKLCCHHIDEDYENNELSNLAIMCASCHSKHHWITRPVRKMGDKNKRDDI
jgi:hypothetical protein